MNPPRASVIGLDHLTVAAMPEEALGVLGRERRERPPHRLDQRLAGARLGFAYQLLDLREGPLDRIEVRRVRRQVKELAAPPLDDLLHSAVLVGRERLSITTNCPGSRVGAKTCS